MLIEFSIENYRSFGEPVTLSMVATPLKGRTREIDRANVFEAGGSHRLLRSAAIYGANASGKTNLVRALRDMRAMVLNSARESNEEDPLPVEPYMLQSGQEKEPSSFEVVFIADDTQYRYGFSATKDRVVSEWLYHVPSQRESLLFQRDADGVRHSKKFGEGRQLAEKTRANALFLSVVAQFNGAISTVIRRWFRKKLAVVLGFDDLEPVRYSMRNYTLNRLKENDSRFRSRVLALVGNADLGIVSFEVQTHKRPEAVLDGLPEELKAIFLKHGPAEELRLLTEHELYDEAKQVVDRVTLDLDEHESHGTQKLVTLAGPLVDTLEQGSILVIDELDARLHPMLTRAIVELFHQPERNPRNAQLVFATHDSNLLTPDLFRRDQIWFTEKTRTGCTQLYSLAEYRGVRTDEAFRDNYLRGKYGAIPIIRAFGAEAGDAIMGDADGGATP